MITESPRWFCLRARPKREHVAAQHLAERAHVEVFAPRLTVRRPRRGGDALLTIEALFPGYLFARFRFPEDYRFVGSTPDVTGIVRFGAHIPTVTEELIDFLRAQVSIPHDAAPVLTLGDWVEVLAGCLVGTEGRLVGFDHGKTRAWVLLSLLGQDRRVAVPLAVLRRSGPACLEFPPQLLANCG